MTVTHSLKLKPIGRDVINPKARTKKPNESKLISPSRIMNLYPDLLSLTFDFLINVFTPETCPLLSPVPANSTLYLYRLS